MYDEYDIDKLMNLENAIFVCFGDKLEDGLPQVETEEDVLLDALQDIENLTRSEAEAQLRGQM